MGTKTGYRLSMAILVAVLLCFLLLVLTRMAAPTGAYLADTEVVQVAIQNDGNRISAASSSASSETQTESGGEVSSGVAGSGTSLPEESSDVSGTSSDAL